MYDLAKIDIIIELAKQIAGKVSFLHFSGYRLRRTIFSRKVFDLTLHTYIFFVTVLNTEAYTMYAWLQAYIVPTFLGQN